MQSDTSLKIPLYHFFEMLRQNEFALGIEEYKTLLNFLIKKFGLGYWLILESVNNQNSPDNDLFPKEYFLRLCKLLWLKPNHNEKLFEELFDAAFFEEVKSLDTFKEPETEKTLPEKIKPLPPPNDSDKNKPDEKSTENKPESKNVNQEILEDENIFVRVGYGEHKAKPDFNLNTNKEVQIEKSKFLFTQNYFPIDRRKIKQNIKRISSFRSLNNSNQIDINATIKKTIERGFFKDVVWLRPKLNTSRVLLLVDNGNSMAAFKQLSAIIKEELESVLNNTSKKEKSFHTLFFHNGSSEYFFENEINTEFAHFDKFLFLMKTKPPAIIIVSDAGAANGTYQKESVIAANSLLTRVYSCSKKVAWINPMPEKRWRQSSANEIANRVAMFETTDIGIKKAVDFIRGSSIKIIKRV